MTKVIGRVWIFGDEINTDFLLPHSALGASAEEQCRLCMSDNRPGWSSLVREGDILVAGRNFGTGSSRPGAAVLKRLGLAGMVAESYNGLFYRNCIGYGFAAIAVAHVTDMFEEGDLAEVDFGEGYIKNIRTGEIRFGNKLTKEMLEIVDAGGIEGILVKKCYKKPCLKKGDL